MSWLRVAAGAVVVFGALVSCGPGRWWETERINGPDGSRDWYVISCRFESDCLATAGRVCRTGYTTPQRPETSARQKDKAHSLVIKCTPPQQPSVASSSPPSQPAPASSAVSPTGPASSAIPVRDYPE